MKKHVENILAKIVINLLIGFGGVVIWVSEGLLGRIFGIGLIVVANMTIDIFFDQKKDLVKYE